MIRHPFTKDHLSLLEPYGLTGLPPELLSMVCYDKKEYLYQEGYPVNSLLLVQKGCAKVLTYTEEGRTLLHSFSGPGSVLGEVEMITGNSDAALYVQAVTPMECIRIPLPECTAMLKENLTFMNQLCLRLAKKLCLANYNSSRIILYSLENRLCSYIEMTSSNGFFEEQLTQVAELLGTSYRHLLRTIEKLCSLNILKKKSRGYVIVDPDALHQKGRGFYSTEQTI